MRPFVWRGLAFMVVFLVALVGLSSGVDLTQRSVIGLGLLERAYYALGLFVLGGLDLGTPTGGPAIGRAAVWVAYFLAPVITASALLEAAVRLIGPLAIRIRPLTDHTVLAGAGRLSMLYVRRLRERDRRRTVVIVERDPAHPRIAELRAMPRVHVVTGNIKSDSVLRSVRVSRAHRVALLTGDDFANLDAAAKILKRAPQLSGRIVLHVADLGFLRQTVGSSVARECEIFNGHEFAATYLVREHLLARFQATPERDLVVLAGFGRFGQTVLHQLQRVAAGSFGRVLIIDSYGKRHERSFEANPGFSDDYDRTVLDGDLLDPGVWRHIGELVAEDGREPVVIVGSGEDSTNLHVALAVRKRYPDAYVIARSFEASPFTAEVADEACVHAFNLAALIGQGMPDEWF